LTGVRVGLKMSGVDADAVDVVVSAVSAGAAAGLTSTASQAVADAYAGLKRLIADRYADVDVTPVQTRPGSTAKRDSLAEDLHDAGAGVDEELVAAAQRVLTVVAEHAPAVGSVIGVDVVGLSAANLRFTDITAEGPGATGLRVREVSASGDVELSRIRATDPGVGPPGPSVR
jgi:hypothetical protein